MKLSGAIIERRDKVCRFGLKPKRDFFMLSLIGLVIRVLKRRPVNTSGPRIRLKDYQSMSNLKRFPNVEADPKRPTDTLYNIYSSWKGEGLPMVVMQTKVFHVKRFDGENFFLDDGAGLTTLIHRAIAEKKIWSLFKKVPPA